MTASKKSSETVEKKATKPSGHEQVVEFLNTLEHPFKKEIEEVRTVILSANAHMSEHIKWNAPSFCCNQEDRITFNLRGKDYFQLIFHCGAKVKDNNGKGQLFDDNTGLLEWITVDRASVKFTDMADVEAKKEKLAVVVNKWIEATST